MRRIMLVDDLEADCPDPILLGATRRETLMSGLASAFLILAAIALHRFEHLVPAVAQLRPFAWLALALWVLITAEASIGYWRTGNYTWSASSKLLLIAILPPYRLTLTTSPMGRCLWLPRFGWLRADADCYERLDRAFSIPMLFMALLILPILGVEVFWSPYVEAYPQLGLALDLGTATIWLAFVTEFVVMSTVAEKKLRYMATHWLNLAIIVLPFLAFLRGFQSLRLLRLGKLGKILKVYRLRGLGLRAWQGMITLELIERVLHRKREQRIRYLRGRLRDMEREVERLRVRIRRLEEDPDACDE
jgi:voltage-gated potassium channel